jgi:hypothetical protein
MVTNYIPMVTKRTDKVSPCLLSAKRTDVVVRVSRWLDEAIEGYISDRKVRLEFPSKRNLVDRAILQFLENRKVNLEKKYG